MNKLTLTCAMLLLAGAAVNAAGFDAEMQNTRCNTDPSRGPLNDPCGSLYEGVCSGSYCSCPPGTGIHPSLKRCKPGFADNSGSNNPNNQFNPNNPNNPNNQFNPNNPNNLNNQSSQPPLGDLPFDYDPNRPNRPNEPHRGSGPVPGPVPSVITSTPCDRTNDPCDHDFNAECYQGHCQCRTGSKINPSGTRCEPDPTFGHGNSQGQDYPNRDHNNHNDHHSAATKETYGVASMVAVVLSLVTYRFM
ncbi:GATA zinc finger domain-containing protein 14 [Hyalella azteca]|uniref:GATA zinc finger domain-containing protein 14 n=1 Tax=Hyalella azteca TaxID=294128 RepID=A0A8B7PLG8_HYAAZ|nr:GATA zinc finger domain-containing protein 14 [Hyalella azteca]